MKSVYDSKAQRNLSALIEFSRIVNSSLNLEFTLNNLLLSCFGKYLVTKGIVALKIEGTTKIAASKGIETEALNKFPVIPSEFVEDDASLQSFLKNNKLVRFEKICVSGKCLGFIALGEKINRTEYSPEEIEFLKTVLNISATAIENALFIDELKRVNRSLDTRLNRLSSLFEVSKEFGLLNEDTRIGKLFLYSLLGHFLLSTYSILKFENNSFSIIESTIPKEKLSEIFHNCKISEIQSPLVNNKINDEYPCLVSLGVELIVPMLFQGTSRGLVLLGKRINKLPYSEDDIEFVSSLASLATVSLENRKLFLDALEKERLEEELEIAKEIQQQLLPGKLPNLANFEMAAFNVSSKQVGGDYYDVIPLDDSKYVVAIADVSGKGVPAALLMANLQAFLKSICKQGMSINKATNIINNLVAENTTHGRFITFFWGILNDAKKTINYVNAGHNPPLLIRDNQITKLNKGGIILGVMKSTEPYLNEEIELKSGDVLVLYTDGITEAQNRKGEEYSEEKLESFVIDRASLTAQELLQEIKHEIDGFTNGGQQSDDITLVVIKVN